MRRRNKDAVFPRENFFPPTIEEKRNVGVFSVSAICSWRRPFLETVSASVSAICSGGKATGMGSVASYSVMDATVTGSSPSRRVTSVKEGSAKARVISRALSGRKLKHTRLSPEAMDPSFPKMEKVRQIRRLRPAHKRLGALPRRTAP